MDLSLWFKHKSHPMCVVCGDEAEQYMLFNELEGSPAICSRCVYHSLVATLKYIRRDEVPQFRKFEK